MHAEQAALVAAVAAGYPDVVALAVASTKARDFTRPCGTCRQIILEHAARCGRSIDVVMVGPGGSCDVQSIDALLPDSWMPASAPASRDATTRLRTGEPHVPQRLDSLRVGDQLLVNDGLIALVWDPAFMPGLALVKPKYLRQADGWAKVPHSFTESALHDAFRERHGFDRPVTTGLKLPVVPTDREWIGWAARPIAECARGVDGPGISTAMWEALGICPDAAFVSGSLATGLHAGRGSDVDLVVRSDGPTVRRLRDDIARGIMAGRLAAEESSRSLTLVTSLFGGRPEQLIAEGRYVESLRVAGRPVSVMYDLEENGHAAVLPDADAWRRECFHGVVREAGLAAGKRSSWSLDCDDGPLDVVCYHRVGTLVREGDRLSVTGWLARGGHGRRVLVQFAVHRDTIAWFHSN